MPLIEMETETIDNYHYKDSKLILLKADMHCE